MRKNNWVKTLDPHEIHDWDQAVSTASSESEPVVLEYLQQLIMELFESEEFPKLYTAFMVASEAHANIPPGFEAFHPSGKAKIKFVIYELDDDGNEKSNQTDEVYRK